jgi:hypothetical protein
MTEGVVPGPRPASFVGALVAKVGTLGSPGGQVRPLFSASLARDPAASTP